VAEDYAEQSRNPTTWFREFRDAFAVYSGTGGRYQQ
jgi:hypothetical protein